MSLMAFYLLDAPSIINEILLQAGYREWNSLNVEYVTKVITPPLRNYGLGGQVQFFQREMITALKNSDVINPSGQFRVSPFIVETKKVMQKLWEPRLFRIDSVNSGMMLSSQDPIRLLDPSKGQVITWKLIPVGSFGQPYVIYTPLRDQVLTVMGLNDITIRPIKYQKLPSQQWLVLPMNKAGGIFKIISVFSKKALDVEAEASNKETSRTQHWGFHGGTNQQWRLTHVQL
jgi:hypothetical protein